MSYDIRKMLNVTKFPKLNMIGRLHYLISIMPLVVIGVLFSTPLFAQTAKPILAILDFEGFDISEPEVATLTNRFRANMVQIGNYTVIERGVMEQILQEQDFQLTGCITDECAVKVGQLLGAQYTLAGSIGKVGSTWTVNMRIINVESGVIEKTAFYDTKGAIDIMLTEGMEKAARRIIAAKRSILTVSKPVTAELLQRLVAVDGMARDYFGFSIDISEEYIVVGAPWYDPGIPDVGTVYVFRQNSRGAWIISGSLVASRVKSNSEFGSSVSLSGDNIIVGAIRDDSMGNGAGAAYLFSRIIGTTEEIYDDWGVGNILSRESPQPMDLFGYQVAISGNDAIVIRFSIGNNTRSVYSFKRVRNGNWTQGAEILPPYATGMDYASKSLDMSGDYAIIGIRSDTNPGGINGESAYVLRRTGQNSWDIATKLIHPELKLGVNFGGSVAISDSFAIVAAGLSDEQGTNSGSIYIFRRTGPNSWSDGVKLTAPDAQPGDQFGRSVAVSDHYIVVGAGRGDHPNSQVTGVAYVFKRTGFNSWDSVIKLTAPNFQIANQFGLSVAVVGDQVLVGAPAEDNERGADAGVVYLYRVK